MASLLSFFSAASLASTAIAVVSFLSTDTRAIAVYALGAVQGALFVALVMSRSRSSRSAPPVASAMKSPEAKAPAPPAEEAASSPRTLLKSVSAVESQALVPLVNPRPLAEEPANKPILLEVEYSVEEYETMRKRQRGENAPASSRRAAKGTPNAKSRANAKTPSKTPTQTPDSSAPRATRSSTRTPRSVSRLVAE
jgi:hypothetical protein